MREPHTSSSAPSKPGSRRRRLWEFEPKHHCLLIGVCFDVKDLRQLIGRLHPVPELISDFELHRCTVQACEQRGTVSELLQKTLERRYAINISQFRHLKTQTELAVRWRTAVTCGDIGASLWAILTHPYCDASLADTLYGELHMLQHQVGSSQRRELSTLHAVQHENRTLLRELANAQTRASHDRDQRLQEIAHLRKSIENLQRERAGLGAQLAHAHHKLEETQQLLPDLADRERLLQRAATAEAQCIALRAQLRAQEGEAQHWQRQARTSQLERTPPEHRPPERTQCDLNGKQVLCIGGRPGIIDFYRQLVEDQGGQFSHHDGGMEENLARLEPSIAAADAVICQTGCINHNAYWRVKDFCKRSGKPCVFVKTPGLSSFQRGLIRLTISEAQL